MNLVRRILSPAAAATLLFCMAAAPARAQAPAQSEQLPNHQHYDKGDGYMKPGPTGALAPRLMNVGTHAFPVTTKNKQAQAFINQGVNLAYGFNHAEAARAFAEAARLDPNCAMAYWGHALVLGPNINVPMDPQNEPKAYELVQKAVSLKSKASQRERDWIDALAKRYTGKADDRKANDAAYADAMRALAKKYPDDLDAATMFAEAMMDLSPWGYWTRDSQPRPGTDEVIAALERVIQRNPKHPGALHYWIHLWEPTKNPEKAEKAADTLLPLAPAAGHLVHMPAHIYQRVGRYQDVVKSNQMAVAADEDYIAQCRAQGVYPLAYYPHNIHFIWFGANLSGQSKLAIQSGKKTSESVPPDALQNLPFLQGFTVVHEYALVRFGKWDEILALPAPRHDSLFTRGIRHYTRGMAFVGKNQLDKAWEELDQLERIAANPELAKIPASFSANTAADILSIAPHVLAGELAARKGDHEQAVAHLTRAVLLQDALIYTEPDDWHYPVRHSLGAVLLAAGRPREAEVVYWQDLSKWPENGWSLFGLVQALKAQGKDDAAALAQKRFEKAWAHADIKLTSSRIMEPVATAVTSDQ
ncbi:MAG: tetratricopeptide repeat protein [Candidatus Acidiferrales bacterium]